MTNRRRRELLAGTALTVIAGSVARASSISGQLPWEPNAGTPPKTVLPGPWLFFTAPEAATVGALADRLIPPDAQTPGGKDAGCAVFIDRQLAGPYGRREGFYLRPPFVKGTKQQGSQSAGSPAELYRTTLAALDRYSRSLPGAKLFVDLAPERQDEILQAMDTASAEIKGADAKTFFEVLLSDVQEGFFADPVYGGNRDMCAWKMIGFPGAHYDYRDWVGRHNERYPHPPVSIVGRPAWTPKT